MLTPTQKDLARHALGLPNRKRTSYRNRFVCPDADPHWSNMVENGLATVRKGETLPFDGDACFYLTRKGAEEALEPREKLSPEDFPVIQTRPILFSAPMIRALLNGQKTQTRRILKTQPQLTSDGLIECGNHLYSQRPDSIKRLIKDHVPFAVGDRLWVREAWRADSQLDKIRPAQMSPYEPILYEADQMVRVMGCSMISAGKLRPSMFMPRWVSRVTLTVTEVRVQRLQDISEADAIAEGVTRIREGCHAIQSFDYDKVGLCHTNAITPFAKLWDSINGADSWDQNPWVTALTFTVEKRNIDQVPA